MVLKSALSCSTHVATCADEMGDLRDSFRSIQWGHPGENPSREQQKGAMGNENLRLPTILPEEEQIIDADQNLGKDSKT